MKINECIRAQRFTADGGNCRRLSDSAVWRGITMQRSSRGELGLSVWDPKPVFWSYDATLGSWRATGWLLYLSPRFWVPERCYEKREMKCKSHLFWLAMIIRSRVACHVHNKDQTAQWQSHASHVVVPITWRGPDGLDPEDTDCLSLESRPSVTIRRRKLRVLNEEWPPVWGHKWATTPVATIVGNSAFSFTRASAAAAMYHCHICK